MPPLKPLKIAQWTWITLVTALPFAAHAEVRVIAFPTDPSVIFSDDYGDPRSGGRVHEGIDMMGTKMMPLYAAVDGTVESASTEEPLWGCRIVLEDAEEYQYRYYHVNNDTPGTDDQAGCATHAYAPGITRGARVTKGQLVGWMGDSGNAESVGAHLHFEIWKSVVATTTQDDNNWGDWRTERISINPYPSLVAARAPGSYDKTVALNESPDINTDKKLVPVSGVAPCTSGSLVKSASSTAVYYCGANGKRYVFPNDRVYFSWYADFKTVVTITNDALAAIPLGGLVTYRPGVRMVKLESLPNVYAVAPGGVLRWVTSPTIAASLYGASWAKSVHDVSDAFFGSYTIGEPITATR
jgi:hypothetical protein